MTKLNKPGIRTRAGAGPVTSERTPTLTTGEGAPGHARDAKSELFLLAVTNMVGEHTFYERADQRDERFERLVAEVAVADPAWMLGFVGWLRGTANMRTASVVAAAEAVKARLDAGSDRGIPVAGGVFTAKAGDLPHGGRAVEGAVTNRKIIAAALQRADEPGEMVAYWMSRHGRAIPKPVKRGIADAVQRLYTEHALLKYDTPSHAVRFGDVLDLVHPAAGTPGQGALFQYALDRRHGRGNAHADGLPMISANAILRGQVARGGYGNLVNPDALKDAGMTWEDALSLAGSRVDKRTLWEALIPSMGYMALLRNLRNFDEADVSDTAAMRVAAKLADPGQVQRSRQFPMRFLSAYRAAPSLRWSWPLEQAIDHSMANIPELSGRTLILVDTSTSMNSVFSKDGTLMRWDAAVVFGAALARRCADADLVSFSSMQMYWGDPAGAKTKVFPVRPGESLLKAVERWKAEGYFLGGGTDTAGALRRHYVGGKGGHDRVVILTDEQAGADLVGVSESIPASTPLFTWNLAGYRAGHAPSGPGRWTFGGLTDAGFQMIPLIERGVTGQWPWTGDRPTAGPVRDQTDQTDLK